MKLTAHLQHGTITFETDETDYDKAVEQFDDAIEDGGWKLREYSADENLVSAFADFHTAADAVFANGKKVDLWMEDDQLCEFTNNIEIQIEPIAEAA